MNSQGTIVTAEGDQLLPAITVPANASNLTISQYGVVTATIPGQTTAAAAWGRAAGDLCQTQEG